MNAEVIKFKSNHTLQEREREAARVRQKYPNRIPVIVEKVMPVPSVSPLKEILTSKLFSSSISIMSGDVSSVMTSKENSIF